MRKKYLSALLFGALLFASAGTFTNDYDDDINNLNQRVDQIASDLADLETKVNALGCVESIEFSDGRLIVHTPNGDVSAAMPEYTGIKEVTLEGNTLYVDGVEAGKVELTGEDGETVHVPVITVQDGKLYVDDQLMDIEVGSNVVLVDNGDTCTITVDGQSVTLMKNAAQLTSIQLEDLEEAVFGGTTTSNILWSKATKATPNWAGEKGAVALNQLLIGQIATVNVQVTPADYDLGAQQLTLVDSRGNVAPIIITAEANNRLMSCAASANGSWTLSATIDQTKVNEGNIAGAFDYDAESYVTGEAMAYTLCVNGKPYTTYDFAVTPANNEASSVTPIHITTPNQLQFVDTDGRVKNGFDNIPVGTTELFIEDSNLYDYYYTFEGTNKSLAEQYGIEISEDGKSIIVPAGAAGVQIGITVHTMSIAGDVVPSATDPVTTNQITLQIAGSEVAAETLAATTHQIVPGDALKEIRVDFGDVFSKFPAANREAARQSGQFEIVEANTQTGFLVEPNWQNVAGEWVFSNVQYFKADGSVWTSSEDILDLSYMTLNVAGDVAADAKPGNYTLEFVATDQDWTAGIYGNELIKVTIPVTIEAPKFADMFDKDANWNAAGDTYTARIFADGMAATLRYADAFEKTAAYADAETSHIGIVFNAIEHNQYPITGWTDEYVTDNTKAVMTYIADGVELDKNVVYNEDGNALEVSELKDMRAYYDVFDGVTASDMNVSMTPAEYEAVTQAFTAVSDPFTTQIKTALDGVAINYYINGVAQSNVKLNNDKTITIGSKPSSGKQGLMFELNGDDLFVTSDNFNASAADRLDIFTLYSAFNRGFWAQMNNYDVDVLFEGANGENVTWNANKALQFDITGESSTLNVILKDATGIDYKLTVKVQR